MGYCVSFEDEVPLNVYILADTEKLIYFHLFCDISWFSVNCYFNSPII